MTEPIKKRHEITFMTGLPMGRQATFVHDGEPWVAYPRDKNKRIVGLLARMIGIHEAITIDMISWINRRPQDTELVAMVLERTARARHLSREFSTERQEAVTQ